ncbi:hypothetical protein V6N12_041629 [Hibiscus sabdariffa]|uniref:Uncharacterized protein n=1 Tax=Hibiscus sabdariffa TaxID=183260 RepID=A0ABR2AZJ4_9ROSI
MVSPFPLGWFRERLLFGLGSNWAGWPLLRQNTSYQGLAFSSGGEIWVIGKGRAWCLLLEVRRPCICGRWMIHAGLAELSEIVGARTAMAGAQLLKVVCWCSCEAGLSFSGGCCCVGWASFWGCLRYGIRQIHLSHVVFSCPPYSELCKFVYRALDNCLAITYPTLNFAPVRMALISTMRSLSTVWLCDVGMVFPLTNVLHNFASDLRALRLLGRSRRLLMASTSAGTHRVLKYTLVFSPAGL